MFEFLVYFKAWSASKLHNWFNIYANFAEWEDFVYWWSFSGGGSAINRATPSIFEVVTKFSILYFLLLLWKNYCLFFNRNISNNKSLPKKHYFQYFFGVKRISSKISAKIVPLIVLFVAQKFGEETKLSCWYKALLSISWPKKIEKDHRPKASYLCWLLS